MNLIKHTLFVISAQSEEDRTVTLLVDGDESTIEFLDNEGFEVSMITYFCLIDFPVIHVSSE